MKYAGAGSFQRNRPLLSFAAGYAGRMADYSFRIATQDDIQAITDIYNAAVIRGGSSADTTPRTYAQRKAWVESHHDPYAVFVTTVPATDAATEGGERIIGFSALSVFGLLPAALVGIVLRPRRLRQRHRPRLLHRPRMAGQGSGHLHTGQTA